MNDMISPSRFLIDTIGLAEGGCMPAKTDGHCVACGAPYCAGERVEPWAPADTFTDYADLNNPSGTHLCGACAALWGTGKTFTQILTKVIVCKDGIYPFFSNDAVAYWLTNPPEGPFLAFISTQQIGHIVWKSTVSLDPNMIMVRYDDKVLRIRRPVLMAGVEAAKLLMPRLIEKAGEDKRLAKAKMTSNNLLVDIDRSLARGTHGHFRPGVEEVARESEAFRHAYDTLKRLNAGELWGLAHILYATEPVRPERKAIPAF